MNETLPRHLPTRGARSPTSICWDRVCRHGGWLRPARANRLPADQYPLGNDTSGLLTISLYAPHSLRHYESREARRLSQRDRNQSAFPEIASINGHRVCRPASHSHIASAKTRSIARKSEIFARMSATWATARLRASTRASCPSDAAKRSSPRTSSSVKPSCRARRIKRSRAMSSAS